MKNFQPAMPQLSNVPTGAAQAFSAPAVESSATPVVDCAILLRGHRQAFITHEGCTYVLRLTRGNKLILTK